MKKGHYIYIHNPSGKGKRVLFIGSEITICNKGFGMLATSEQKDFVHICQRFINMVVPDSCYCTAMSNEWEKNYLDPSILTLYDDCKKFAPDVIVFQIGDHIDEYSFDKKVFKKKFMEFLYHVDPFRNAKVLLMTAFKPTMSDYSLQELAIFKKYPCIFLGDFCQSDGFYEISDGKKYPNDQCMDEIAKAILCIIENYLRK